jgi:hypothetical protein
MKKNVVKNKSAQTSRLRDDLRPHYDVDYSKSRPNRFAGRVRFSHGGPRAGAGRKKAPQPIERHTITLYKAHADYLRGLDRNLSQAIRKLIEGLS